MVISGEATHLTTGCQPTASVGTYTIPQRLTVAGEAAMRSDTSNSMRMVVGLSLIRSPLGRHRVQLSSSTAGQAAKSAGKGLGAVGISTASNTVKRAGKGLGTVGKTATQPGRGSCVLWAKLPNTQALHVCCLLAWLLRLQSLPTAPVPVTCFLAYTIFCLLPFFLMLYHFCYFFICLFLKWPTALFCLLSLAVIAWISFPLPPISYPPPLPAHLCSCSQPT